MTQVRSAAPGLWQRPVAVRLAGDRFSAQVPMRALIVCTALFGLLSTLFIIVLSTGAYSVSFVDVVRSLLHNSSQANEFAVNELRLPRATLAVVAGAALGVAGALFQSVTGNPLASPDVVGMQSGAATGALLQILVFGATGSAIAAGALVGGIVAALLVLAVVPLRQAGGYRFVLAGIALAALFNAVNDYLVTHADLTSALSAALWQTGSLNEATWPVVVPVAIAFVVLFPVSLWVSSGLRALALGDDLAAGVGARVTATRLVALGAAVLLTATATAGCGPLLFVALASGQIGRRLIGRPAPAVATAALVGALLTLTADFVAQRMFPPTGLPVGVLTGVLGGAYLALLLAMQWRRR